MTQEDQGLAAANLEAYRDEQDQDEDTPPPEQKPSSPVGRLCKREKGPNRRPSHRSYH